MLELATAVEGLRGVRMPNRSACMPRPAFAQLNLRAPDSGKPCSAVTLRQIVLQVVDRPTQGHRFLSRQYVQPQWVLDAANWRVLPDPSRYAPGVKPPPHLSPFVNDDDEGYVPDYAAELRRLQASRSDIVSTSSLCDAGPSVCDGLRKERCELRDPHLTVSLLRGTITDSQQST